MTERILPRNFPVPPEFIIPLSNAELQELGTFTAIWSQIDWIILMMVSHITRTDIRSVLLFMEAMTTGPRVGLLKKLCQDDPDEIKKKVAKLCDDNGGLIEDRNHIIHGLWALHWDYQKDTVEPACLFKKGKRTPIFIQKLPVLSDRAAKFSNDLGELLQKMNPSLSATRPRPFLFGDGSPPATKPPPSWPPK